MLVLLILLGYQLIALFGPFPAILLPSLQEVGLALVRGFLDGQLLLQLGFSLLLVAAGTLGGAFLAAALTAISSLGRRARRSAELLQALFHPLPGIALLPLVVLWIGTGTPAVLAVMLHSSLWPVFVSLFSALDDVPLRYREMAQNWEMRRRQWLINILVPFLFPSFLAGLRTAWARSWRALIAAEMVFGAAGRSGGLGWFLFQRRVYMDTPGLFAGLLVVMAAGVLVDRWLFERLQRHSRKRWGRM